MRIRYGFFIIAIAGLILPGCTVMKRKISEQLANQLIESGGELDDDTGFVGKAYLATWNAKLIAESATNTLYTSITVEFLSDKEASVKMDSTIQTGDDEKTETTETTMKFRLKNDKVTLSTDTGDWILEIREGSFVTTADHLTRIFEQQGYRCENYTEALIFSEI